MNQTYGYIELSFIKDFKEIKRQVINTLAITFLLGKKGTTSLDDYLENTQYGYTASALQEGSFHFLRITDINNGTVDWNSVPYCECKEGDKYLLKEGDILIARTGGTTGKSFLINDLQSNAIFASYLIRLRANKKCIPRFLDIFLNSYVFWSQISELKSGSAQPNVNAEKLKRLLVPTCPVDEQKKIVALLDKKKVDESDLFTTQLQEQIRSVISLLEDHEAIKKELDQQQSYLQLLRQTILQDAVQGRLTEQNENDEPASELLKRIKAEKLKFIKEGKLKKEKELSSITEEEIPFELPSGWQWCRLNDIVEVKSGVTLGKIYKKEDLYEVPYLRVANVQRGYIDINHLKTIKVPTSEIKKYELKRGDLCMIEGGDWDKVGRCAIWEHDINPCIHQNHIFKLRFHGGIVKEWCEIYLNSPIARRYFENFSKQTTNLASINKTQLRSLLFPLPPIEEQSRILLKVNELQNQVNLLEVQVAQNYQFAEQLLETLLKDAFSVSDNAFPFERKVLAGHIINMCYQDNYFGLVKFQKTLHVCEHHAQVEYNTNYEQEVAGPYDRSFTLAFKKEMIEEDWFQQEIKISLNRFIPGRNAGKLQKEFPKYFRKKGKEIRLVLQLFQGKTLEESELISTLYAVWNNRIIRKESTDGYRVFN
jgi:type I restriction enzyme S subunit